LGELVHLDVSFNAIAAKGAEALAVAISERSESATLKLDLSGNELGPSVSVFSKCVKEKRLQVLKLAHTQYDPTGSTGMYELFDGLQVLSLAGNSMGDEGCLNVADGMLAVSMPSIQMLELQNNRIGL